MRATPPGPDGDPVLGNARRYADDPFAFLAACGEAYGDVVRLDLGPEAAYMVTDPAEIGRVLVDDEHLFGKPAFQDEALGDLLGDGLLLSEGETWRAQRRRAAPAFGPGRLRDYTGTIGDYAAATLAGWRDGTVRDVQVDMTDVTLRVICELMLGVGLDDERVTTVRENLEPLGRRFELRPLELVLPDWVPTRRNREYRAARERLERLVDGIIAERRDGDVTGDDLLSILLRARDRGEQPADRIRDEVLTTLLAGHDTTALSLTYALYLLGEHPEAERRLHAEVDAVLDDGRPPGPDAVDDLEYTEWVLKEAMRLYPPVYVMFRRPKVDVRIGGYRIPAGASVMLPQWVVHRSPDHWTDPDRFDPERWRPERAADRPRFAYFPFGGGPRHCIGKHLAMLEGRVILSTTVARYRCTYVRDEPLDLRGSLTMHPETPVEMRVRAR